MANASTPTASARKLALRSHAQRLLLCVEALHKKRLVHCDIKSKHFLRFGGEWKLIDYDAVLEEGERRVPNCTWR